MPHHRLRNGCLTNCDGRRHQAVRTGSLFAHAFRICATPGLVGRSKSDSSVVVSGTGGEYAFTANRAMTQTT